MDKQTLSNYGWIIILVLILAVLLALASPFGLFVSDAIKGVTGGFWDVNSAALNVAGIDTGDVGFSGDPEKCGVEGHYIGDNKGPHGIPVTDCKSGHTYTCECDGWTVPNGGKYYVGVTSIELGNYTGATKVYNEAEKLPCGYVPKTGDTYVNKDYEYKYNYDGLYNYAPSKWYKRTSQNGWGVKVLDNTKTLYCEIHENVANKPVTNMNATFYECASLTKSPEIPNSVTTLTNTFDCCTSLTIAPKIPNNVTSMGRTFGGCTALINPPDMSEATNVTYMATTFFGCEKLKFAPIIPNSVTNMSNTFAYCSSLTTVQVIPESVMNMNSTFLECASLKGQIEMNATPTSLNNCFKSVDFNYQNLTLTGSSIMLDSIGATGNNYCSTCNGCCSSTH